MASTNIVVDEHAHPEPFLILKNYRQEHRKPKKPKTKETAEPVKKISKCKKPVSQQKCTQQVPLPQIEQKGRMIAMMQQSQYYHQARGGEQSPYVEDENQYSPLHFNGTPLNVAKRRASKDDDDFKLFQLQQ